MTEPVDLAAATTADLLRILRTCDLDVPPGLAEELVRRREETIDPLCEILLDESHDSWAHIHALQLLGAMGDGRGAPALAEVIRRDSDLEGEFLGDWLTEDVPGIMACMPGEAYDTFEPLLRDPALDTFHRFSAAEGLFGIAIRHPEHRQRLVDLCCERIAGDDDLTLATCLIDLLARAGHPDVVDLYDREARAGRVDSTYLDRDDLAWIIDHWTPWTEPRFDRDPLDHFKPARLEELRQIQEEAEDDDGDDFYAADRLQPRRVVSIGRNDPCPCGSGRKYKKCCLGTDRDPARSN